MDDHSSKEWHRSSIAEQRISPWKNRMTFSLLTKRDAKSASAIFVGALILWALYASFAAPQYKAVMIVGPTPANVRSSFSNLLPSAVIPFLGDTLSQSQTNDFDVFRELLTSDEVAKRLLQRPDFTSIVLNGAWNPKAHKWRIVEGVGTKLHQWVLHQFGVHEVWSNESRLSQLLHAKIEVTPLARTGFIQITARMQNPRAALILLRDLYSADDGYLRQIRADRLQKYGLYLQSRLDMATNEAHRTALINLIIRQEQQLMLAQSNMPFAAEMIRSPSISPWPVSPRPLQWLWIAILLSFLTSGVVIYYNRKRSSTSSK